MKLFQLQILTLLMWLANIAVFAANASAMEAGETGDALHAGLVAVHQKDWPSAVAALERAASTGCQATTYYLLGLSYANLHNFGDTIDNETKALSCVPRLAAPYDAGARDLISWAARGLAGSGSSSAHFTMSKDSPPKDPVPKEPDKTDQRADWIAKAKSQVPDLEFILEADKASRNIEDFRSRLLAPNPAGADPPATVIPTE